MKNCSLCSLAGLFVTVVTDDSLLYLARLVIVTFVTDIPVL